MAVLSQEDWDLWLAAEHPDELATAGEVPEWLGDDGAALLREEPLCDCGCGRTRSEVEDLAVSAPAPQEPVRWAIPGVWDDDPPADKVVPSVGELVGQAQELIGRIATVDASLLPPGQALGEAEALAAVQHRLRLLQLARTQDVTDRKLFEQLGFRSVTAWQQQTAPDTAKGDRALARALPGLPGLTAALAGQQVCFAAAGKVKTALGKVRVHLDPKDGLIDGLDAEQVEAAVVLNVLDLVCRQRFGVEHDPAKDPVGTAFLTGLERELMAIQASGGTQRERVEAAMVLLAQHLPVGCLNDALDELVQALVPSLLETQQQDAQGKRGLSMTPNSDGTWELSGTLTPEVGEQLHTALAAEARRDPANPQDTHAREAARAATAQAEGADPWAAAMDRPAWEDRALREHGELGPDSQLVPRSRSKRLHDAFGRLLTRYLEHGLGGLSGKVPVQVTLTVAHRTVEGAPGAPPARGGSGRPLARSLLRRWWCDAHVTTLLMSRGWKPLGVIHSARTITGTELKAVRAQYGNRCAGLDCCPGTPDPLTPLVPHHLRLHSVFGETSIDQTILACDRLHADIHVGKRTIRLRDGRLITEDGYLEQG